MTRSVFSESTISAYLGLVVVPPVRLMNQLVLYCEYWRSCVWILAKLRRSLVPRVDSVSRADPSPTTQVKYSKLIGAETRFEKPVLTCSYTCSIDAIP